MARYLTVGLGLLAACSLFGQGRGGRAPARDFGLVWGNVLFPGGVRPLTFPSNAGFATRLGNTVAGSPYTGAPSMGGGYGGRPGQGPWGGGRRTVVVPVPVYVGGYSGYTPMVDAPPNVTVVLQPPAGQAPLVFNQNYMPNSQPQDDGTAAATAEQPRSSGLRTYEAPGPYREPDPVEEEQSAPRARSASGTTRMPQQAPAAGIDDQKATIYLIAFKDQSIQAAYAYWMDGNTLHYVTVQGSHNRATLDLIDRDMSDRLNRERGVEWSLSAAAR